MERLEKFRGFLGFWPRGDMIHKNRILFLDILRIMSIFAVILIHSIYPLGERIDQTIIFDWWIANIYGATSRWSVPIMVMISGALLLNSKKDESIPIFFKKRVSRIFVPILFWSVFYMFWNGIDLQMSTIMLNFITGQVNFHLWFVFLIMGLYLTTPILRIYIKNADEIHVEYFIFFWIVSIINTYMKTRYGIGTGIEIGFFTGFIGYYILGYYLTNIDFDKKYKNLIYILSISGAFITTFGTYILTKDTNLLDQSYYSYLSPNVMVMSIGIFIFFKNIDWKKIEIFNNLKIIDVITKMSILSFGAYLIHALILSILANNLIGSKLILLLGPIIGIPLYALIVMLISYLLVEIIDNVPILKYII